MSSPCRAAALRFLKIRPRSVVELQEKLKGKKFPSQEIQEAVDYLATVGLLNDRVFADGWIRWRLTRPFGFRRIIGELKAKGITEGIIAAAVDAAKGEYAEHAVIAALAARRAQRLGQLDPPKKRKRVFDFLVRRGFSTDAALKAVKNI